MTNEDKKSILFTEKVARIIVAVIMGGSALAWWPFVGKALSGNLNLPEEEQLTATSKQQFVGSVQCTSGGQLCNNHFTTDVSTDEVLKVRYKVPDRHCSPLRVHFYVDGQYVDSTGLLGWKDATGEFSTLPLQSAIFDFGPVDSGTYTLGLEAEGQQGGCNTGTLSSWTAIVDVWVSR